MTRIILLIVLSVGFYSWGEVGTKIQAVVGKDVITYNDLEKRFNVVTITNGIQITNDQQAQQLYRQILRSLVNEKIFLQEAKRLKISASEKEINNAIHNIELNNSIPKGKFFSFLKEKGIAKEDALAQITNSIIWNKILEQIISPQVQVSSTEIREYSLSHFKKEPVDLKPEQRQQIYSELMDKKVQLQAEYYMKNLSKKTYIEFFR